MNQENQLHYDHHLLSLRHIQLVLFPKPTIKTLFTGLGGPQTIRGRFLAVRRIEHSTAVLALELRNLTEKTQSYS